MNKLIINLKKMFGEPMDKDINLKSFIIGAFSGLFIIMTIFLPAIFYHSILESLNLIPVTQYSNIIQKVCIAIIGIIPILGYLSIWYILKKEIIQFCINCSIVIWRDYEKDNPNIMEKLVNVKPQL